MSEAPDIRRWRLAIAVWIATVLVMATNITREHYPAFAVVDGTAWQCDRYAGFHSDIFLHTDGHWYINNNIGSSAIAAIPLWIASPLLDRVEAISKSKLNSNSGSIDASYSTPFPNRERMYRLARERGLDLRFGVSTLVIAALLLGPLAALASIAMATHLRDRGLSPSLATWLGFAGIVATPLLFRGATLNHNLFVAYATLGVWIALESSSGRIAFTSRRVITAGLFSGVAMMCDYSGAMTALWAGLLILTASETRWKDRLRFASILVAASLPGLAVQFHAQWLCFGNPWLPPARWMTDANFTNLGWRGFDLPSPDLLVANLIDPRFGLIPFAPLLLLGFFPPRKGSLISTSTWRRGCLMVALYLLFASSNQYARMQWNTGFRYLTPVIIPLWMATCAMLATLPRRLIHTVLAIAITHTLVLTTSRLFNVADDWERLLSGDFKLPIFDTLARTASGRELANAVSSHLPGSPSKDAVRQFMEGPIPSVTAVLIAIVAIYFLLRPVSRVSNSTS